MTTTPRPQPVTHATEVDAVRADSLALIREHSAGDTAFKLSSKLGELVAAVREKQGKGSLTLRIDLRSLPKFGPDAMEVSMNVAVKLPAEEPASDVRFATAVGDLVTEDPRQMKLGFGQESEQHK